jgi:signal transduction histidine kinase
VFAITFRACLVLVLCFCCAATARADEVEPFALTGPAGIAELAPHVRYAADSDWRFAIDDFAGQSQPALQPLPEGRPDFGYTAARIWLVVPLANRSERLDDWRFHIHVAFLQKLAVWRIAPDGRVTTLLDLAEDSPFEARPVDFAQVAVPFELNPGEAATFVVAYYSMGASRHAFSIETAASFDAKARMTTAKNFALYGMMLVMVALALVALATLRQAVFAAYAAYVASVFVYIAHADGMAFQYLWPGLPQFNSMAATVAGSCIMVFGALFAMIFLETWRYHPIVHRVLVALIGCVLVLDVLLWAIDPKLLNRLLVYMVLVSVLTFLAAGLIAARTRFREVRFYVLSWAAAVIPVAMFTARFAFGLESAFITPYDAIRLGVVFEALMMGLAVFDRYNHLRQTAMEETVEHAERSLALSTRLAVLEERYAQAATLARQREESVKDTVHDLRQPMHALRLSLRQMFAGKGGGGDAGQVESALGYMERLVAERLAEEPQATRATTPVPTMGAAPEKSAAPSAEPGLHGVLRGVADMFTPEAVEKGLALRLVLAAPDAGVAAYPLMRVVANLVSNAIKYTRTGRVVLALRREGKGHRVEIHDTGPGLSGPAFAQALQRNARLERDLNAAEGSGLGLAVASDTAAAHGWTIEACESRRTGASIRLHIPDLAG